MVGDAVEAEPVPLRGVQPLPAPLQTDVVQRQWHQVARGSDDVAALRGVDQRRHEGFVATLHLHLREEFVVEEGDLEREEGRGREGGRTLYCCLLEANTNTMEYFILTNTLAVWGAYSFTQSMKLASSVSESILLLSASVSELITPPLSLCLLRLPDVEETYSKCSVNRSAVTDK
jgi:hypothetical protein